MQLSLPMSSYSAAPGCQRSWPEACSSPVLLKKFPAAHITGESTLQLMSLYDQGIMCPLD